MSEVNKENSSLELYETAYKLHYSEGNIPEAVRIYKALIDEFPNSNECGYAVIQLQKILANDVSDHVKTGKTSNAIKVFGACIALACVAIIVFSFGSLKKVNSQIEALSLVSQALSIMYAGNDNNALELLNKAKTLSHGTLIDPYLLSASIYMNMQNYSRARIEFESYQKLSGKSDSIFKKLVTIRVESEKAERLAEGKADSLMQNPSPGIAPPEGSPAAATFKPEKIQPPMPKTRPRMERARSAPNRPGRRSPSGSVPDSVSFF
jgi:outer membrane protein assembly factor BamD (BamD/ComL family)